jgi:hypothetical protein
MHGEYEENSSTLTAWLQEISSIKQKNRNILCDITVLIPGAPGCGYQSFGGTQTSILFLNFENETNVFLRQNMKANLLVLLHDTPGMSAVVEEQRFRELFNSDILSNFCPLEFLVKKLHSLRIGGWVTQPSSTCG